MVDTRVIFLGCEGPTEEQAEGLQAETGERRVPRGEAIRGWSVFWDMRLDCSLVVRIRIRNVKATDLDLIIFLKLVGCS